MEGAVFVADEAGFVEREAIEVVELLESEGGAGGGIGVEAGAVVVDLEVEEGGFGGPEAAEAPFGGGEVFDGGGFGGGGGLEVVEEFGEEGGEALGGFGVEDDGLGVGGVAGERGPRERAPLRREAARCFSERSGMGLASNSGFTPSPRSPLMCAYRVCPARTLISNVPKMSTRPGAFGLV